MWIRVFSIRFCTFSPVDMQGVCFFALFVCLLVCLLFVLNECMMCCVVVIIHTHTPRCCPPMHLKRSPRLVRVCMRVCVVVVRSVGCFVCLCAFVLFASEMKHTTHSGLHNREAIRRLGAKFADTVLAMGGARLCVVCAVLFVCRI